MENSIKYSWSIRNRLILFFLLLVILITISFYYTQSIYASFEKQQRILELASQNKEIVEEVVIYTLELAQEQAALELSTNRQIIQSLLANELSRFDIQLKQLMLPDKKEIESATSKQNNTLAAYADRPAIRNLLDKIHQIWFAVYRREAQIIYEGETFLRSQGARTRETKDQLTQSVITIEQVSEKLITLHEELISEYRSLFAQYRQQSNTYLWIFWIANVCCILFGIWLIQRWLIQPLTQITTVAQDIGEGNLSQKINYQHQNEVGLVATAINGMVDKIKNATDFIKSIEKGDLSVSYTGLNGTSLEKDTLAGALINMREKMKAVASDEEERNWATKGLALFGEILQTHNDDTETLSYEIISNLIKYLDANQGGLFIVNDEEEEIQLELIASYAFNRKKYVRKFVAVGEGLVGQAFKDADTIYITDIPDNYVDITSGLGGERPKSVLVVPLKMNERVYGVMELASFYEFTDYEISFLEKLGENIASNLYAARANERTKKLLIESNSITEQMRRQEQEMRSNLRVLEDTQMEMQKNQEALAAQSFAIKSTLITVELSMDRTILSANDLFLEATQYKSEELIGEKQDSLVPDSQIDKSQYEKLWRDLRAGIPHSGEFKRLTKDGGEIWLKATYSPIKDKNGNPYKILKLAFDITEDKRLRLDFKEQLDSFKRSSAIVEFGLDGHIIDANDNFLDLMEYDREEIIGENHTLILPEEEKESKSYQALWHKLRQGSYHIGEVKRITKTGKTVWFQGSFNPILDLNGKPYKIIEFIIDITARKNAEARIIGAKEELQAKEANLTALLNNTDDAIYTIGPNYRITMLNESARKFYEKLGESIRLTSSVLDCLPRNYYYIWKGYYDRALAGEKFSVEQPIFSEKTNQKFYLSVYFNPITDDNTEVTGVAIFSRDITHRKQRELDIAEFTKKQATRTARIIENQKQTLMRAMEQFEEEKNALQEEIFSLQAQRGDYSDELDFLQQIDCVALAINQDHDVVRMNKKAKRTYQYWHYYLQPDYYFPDTFPQHKFDEWKALCDQALEGQSFKIEQIFPNHHRKDFRVFSISFQPVKNDKHEVIYVVISAWDITRTLRDYRQKQLRTRKKLINRYKFFVKKTAKELEREKEQLSTELHKVEKQTEQQAEMLKLLDNNTQDVILRINQEYQITSSNTRCKEVFFLWHFYLQPDYYLPDTFPQKTFYAWKALCDRALAGEEFTITQGFINDKRAEFYLFEIHFVPELDAEGRVCSVVITAQDITEQRDERRTLRRVQRTQTS